MEVDVDGSVKQSIDEGILLLTLSNTATSNSLTPSVLNDLESGLERARSNDVRVVVLAAEGKNFCSGGDMRYLGLDDENAGRVYIARVTDTLATLRQFPKLVLAAVQGYAVGGGAEIACEADLLLLSSDAVLQFSDVTIGSTPATAYRLVRLVGLGPASRMVLLGTPLTAGEALQRGLALEVVEREELLVRAVETARRVAGFSPRAVGFAKQGLRLAQGADPLVDLQVNLEAEAACYGSEEMKTAVRRFLEAKAN